MVRPPWRQVSGFRVLQECSECAVRVFAPWKPLRKILQSLMQEVFSGYMPSVATLELRLQGP